MSAPLASPPGPGPANPERRAPTAALAVGLFAGTLALFAGALRAGFVNYDDDRYVTANEVVQQGLGLGGLRWAFTTQHASNWHPLTWLSHMLDVQLFGLEPGGHHGTSVVLHALTAALLFLAFATMTRRAWPAFFACALFAWHPLRVESVAWIAERKDVLSGALAAATILAWAGYARAPGVGRYLFVLVPFALGLMAKPMLVTLPFVLLLLDRWPLERTGLGWGHLLREKVPLLLLAGGSIAITLVAQTGSGATELLRDVPPAVTLANASASVWTYAQQTLWPTGLACFYPHAAITSSEPLKVLAAPAALGALSIAVALALAVRARATCGAWLTGLLWFLGTLVPVLGLVQVGTQGHADRYTYLPAMGLSVALAYGVADAMRGRARLRKPLILVTAAALAVLGLLTIRQVRVWHDPLALWRHALAVTADNYVAHNNLGRLLVDAGDLEEAGAHFARSLEIRPGTPPDPEAATVATNLAGTQTLRGLTDEALATLKLAVELDPEAAFPQGQLGALLSETGRDRQALPYLRRARELNPRDLATTDALAWLLATSRHADLRDGEEAVRLAERANRLTGFARHRFLETLAAAHAEAGDRQAAVEWQLEAIQRAPEAERPEMRGRLARYEGGRPYRKRP